jgi:hypothetical protein
MVIDFFASEKRKEVNMRVVLNFFLFLTQK